MSGWIVNLTIALSGLSLSWLLTGAVRRYALATGMIDRPNERSSHTVPTPRGGGVGFVLSFLLISIAAMPATGQPMGLSLIFGGGFISVLGFVDDRRPLAARWRFCGHVIAAAACVWAVGPAPMITAFGARLALGVFGSVLAVLFVVWMINLYNFMDGIDGIASVQAISVAGGGGILWALAGPGEAWLSPVLLAACVAGFLLWNFPPAKIFMGDAGSGFLGLILSVTALWCVKAHPELLWSWLILTGCFMVDATATLVQRVRRGERFYEAHRSHAYQHASRVLGSHKAVTLGVAAINLLWLLPWAATVARGSIDGAAGMLIAYAPLIWIALHFRAGDRSAQAT